MNTVGNLLSIEWRKISRLRSIQLIFLFYTLLTPSWMWFYVNFIRERPKLKILLPSAETFCSFPEVWGFTAWSASFFNILLGIIVIILTTNEIQFRTQKQNIIDGLSKVQMIWSRLLAILIVSGIVLIYTALVAIITGSIFESYDFYPKSHMLFIYGFQTICYLAVAFLIANLLKKPAVSIILFVCYFPFEKIIAEFVPVTMKNLLPFQSFARLTPFPFERLGKALSSNKPGAWEMSLSATFFYSFFLIVLIYGLTFWLLKRRDL